MWFGIIMLKVYFTIIKAFIIDLASDLLILERCLVAFAVVFPEAVPNTLRLLHPTKYKASFFGYVMLWGLSSFQTLAPPFNVNIQTSLLIPGS